MIKQIFAKLPIPVSRFQIIAAKIAKNETFAQPIGRFYKTYVTTVAEPPIFLRAGMSSPL
jgi:hypothetical protein